MTDTTVAIIVRVPFDSDLRKEEATEFVYDAVDYLYWGSEVEEKFDGRVRTVPSIEEAVNALIDEHRGTGLNLTRWTPVRLLVQAVRPDFEPIGEGQWAEHGKFYDNVRGAFLQSYEEVRVPTRPVSRG